MDAGGRRPRRDGRREKRVAMARGAVVALVASTTSLATAPGASAQSEPDTPEVTVTELAPLPGASGGIEVHDIDDAGNVVGQVGWAPVVWEEGQPTELPIDPGTSLSAMDINDRGEIVVASFTRAYHWLDGQVTDINPPGDYEIDVVDLNESGQVLLRRTPTFQDAANKVSIVELWQDGTSTDLRLPPPPEGLRDRLAGISDSGHVVFEYGETAAFGSLPIWRGTGGVLVWHAGTVTRLTYSEAVARAVNGSGQVVGNDLFGGVLWSGGRTTRLGLSAVDINDRGQVVGSATVNGLTHAALWENGRVTDLGTLGGNTSRALTVNERGQVLGESQAADGATHAVLWTNGHVVDLGPTQGSAWIGYALNDEGQAIGPLLTPAGVKPVMWTVHDDGGPTEPPAEQCFTAINQAHVQAGRATSWLVLTWAVGSGTYLGLTSQTTSLRQAAPGSWQPATTC
jgi:probable HAF family extracellular repeat protein